MKRFITILGAVTLAATLAGAASAQTFDRGPSGPNCIDRREWRQSQRIHQGVRRGDLTRPEARRLWAGQMRIHRMERRGWRDGRLTNRERFRMERTLDRQNRRIFRLRHNGRSV